MKAYRVKDEFVDLFYGSADPKDIRLQQDQGIDEDEIRRLAIGWHMELEDLLDELEEMQPKYYWFDTENCTLYSGSYDEDGQKDRDTEKCILSFRYEDAGIENDGRTDDAQVIDDNWKKIDSYITNELGFLPDYEIN